MKVLEELNKMIAAANDIAEKQGLQEKISVITII